MQMLRACVAGALLWAAGGCSSDGDVVSLTFEQATNLQPALTAFHATAATATPASDGTVHFVAMSSEGTLTMDILGPLAANTTVTFGQAHNSASFDITNGGWSSNSGTLTVVGVSPYRLRFDGVTMLKGAGPDTGPNAVTGSFVIRGSGTFK
jgi:hypothetical protein